MNETDTSVGGLLRTWRQRRRLSQLDLACEAGISQRHLSFVESGRSQPSRDMVLHLAEQLSIPLRERNALLVAAGYAPMYREGNLTSPNLAAARNAVEAILRGHSPHPALAIDRHWTLLMANDAAQYLMTGVDPTLLSGSVNVLRVSLHPQGLASRIRNYHEWRAFIFSRLVEQIDASADPILAQLLEELKQYPAPPKARPHQPSKSAELGGIAVPLELSVGDSTLRLLSATTVFGTAVDVHLSELAIESFFPADAETTEHLRRFAEKGAVSTPA